MLRTVVLLHFTSTAAYCTSAQAQRLLERHAACGYTAQRRHLEYAKLADHFGTARRRARELRLPVQGRAPQTVNPWTDVDTLIDALREPCG
ncbi:hypothetical protein QNO07_03535 [Streptomyces sp. 549]|uniref:hypothetical protein n=1 Tax=Streptomyces sp. 549 TaxID=3049076 RepID=UPI0024C39298|nr:hypothetical protein [Streptomyces sp. 549]MDK1472506.1 hypothetical protein [Streptomyces sp. 549]